LLIELVLHAPEGCGERTGVADYTDIYIDKFLRGGILMIMSISVL